MTDKQQPEALELASVAESADLVGYPTAKKANAYYLCLLEDCAQMIRKLHAELERLALYKSLADEYGLSIFPDIAEMTAELETLRAKLKTYEDLGGAASDVQLLRMGYAAARLEIESLKAQSAGAQPAAQPSYEHQRAIMEGERNASLDAYSRVVSITSAESRLYERAFTSGWDRRDRLASYGQAPAQAAPAVVAVADEIGRLRAALVYVAFALHDTRQYMLAEGITLIDGDTVRVSRDGWTVEASSNPLRQPAPQPAPAAQGDAARYRWLRLALADRTNNGKSHWFCSIAAGHPEELDSAIDAARKQGGA